MTTAVASARPSAVVGRSMVAPFEVFLNYVVIANYGDDQAAAEAHYAALRARPSTTPTRGET